MKLQMNLRESDPFAALLYEARRKGGTPGGKPLPMRKAADALDTTEVTYGEWERGKKKPALTLKLLKALVKFTKKDALTVFNAWCAREESNLQPDGYQFAA